MKVKSRREFQKILKAHNFIMVSSKKHEKWTNGIVTIHAPNNHKEFHVISHMEILKKAGIITKNC